MRPPALVLHAPPMRRAALLALAFLALTGCATPRVTGWVHEGEHPALPEGPIALARPVLLLEVPGAAPSGPYEDNLFVGHIYHAGGYVLAETAGGSVHRSKNTELTRKSEYEAQARTWLAAAAREAVEASGREVLEGPALEASTLAAPSRVKVRGSHPDDGRDNLNLPRYRLAPAPMPADESAPALVFVPFVTSYYTHNGGWFSGQTYGCGGGARVRLFWVVYDGRTGTPLAHGEVDARSLEPMENQPAPSRVEDFLMETEAEAARRLTDALGEAL